MTFRVLLLSICLGGAALAPALAQAGDQTPPAMAIQPPQTPPRVVAPTAAPPATPPRERPPAGQAVNIKVDVTITDQHSGGTPLKKTVSVVTGDALSGYVRTEGWYSNSGQSIPLNVDVEPFLLADGKIRLRVNLQYDLPGNAETPPAGTVGRLNRAQIKENLAVILESGKPLVVAQSADPVTDRQVTVEVKATVLK